ncbi:MAG: ABC transporter permease [Deltaproteobacteria bacterium]|nr:MAG: ABC transporter permease [Deltaproteobacteria bacterium]RLC15611.1 MAG: ABC transporter permease [Deltaproteobacteria bacterium]
MIRIFRIALRNLMRYKRRTLLTSMLITLGVLMVILFSGLAGSFKEMMIGQITDSNLAQMQIHKKGYVSSIDTSPLNLTINQKGYKKIEKLLKENPDVEAYSPRIKLSAMLSNFKETTNIRLNAIDPKKERKVCPNVSDRMKFSGSEIPDILLKSGEIIIPEKLAKGLKIKIGDPVVLVANNKDGSVNGLNFTVAGVIESLVGPQGKEGYMHIEDARSLLRMEKPEIIEIALRIKKFDKLDDVYTDIESALTEFKNKKGKLAFEIHTWEKLSPFANIARMIDFMTISMKLIMIAIVLISVLNVMMMSVYERVREIGTMSAIGTAPGKIMGLFLAEGLSLGLISTLAGNIIGIVGIYFLNIYKIPFAFGRNTIYLLSPTISFSELVWVTSIVLLISVFATLQPAYKASKMEPVDALGHV